jgi:hypothetical protein
MDAASLLLLVCCSGRVGASVSPSEYNTIASSGPDLPVFDEDDFVDLDDGPATARLPFCRERVAAFWAGGFGLGVVGSYPPPSRI